MVDNGREGNLNKTNQNSCKEYTTLFMAKSGIFEISRNRKNKNREIIYDDISQQLNHEAIGSRENKNAKLIRTRNKN